MESPNRRLALACAWRCKKYPRKTSPICSRKLKERISQLYTRSDEQSSLDFRLFVWTGFGLEAMFQLNQAIFSFGPPHSCSWIFGWMFQLLLSSLVDGCWWLGIPYSLLLPEMKIVKTRNRVPAKYTLFNTIYWFIYTSPKIYCSKKNSWGWKDMTVVVMASLNLPSRRKIWRQKSSFPRCLIKEKHDTRSMGKTAYDALERWWRHRMFCFFFSGKKLQ